MPSAPTSRWRAIAAARAADAKKAKEILLLDVRKVCSFTDWFVIATVLNPRHAQAVADEVVAEFRREGTRPIGFEGYQEGRWICLDYGSFVIHLFHDAARKFYDLEMLWGDGKKVRWESS